MNPLWTQQYAVWSWMRACLDQPVAPLDNCTNWATTSVIDRTNSYCRPTGAHHIWRVSLIVIFLLGVANFAMHGAVMHSGHPLLATRQWYLHRLGGRATVATEFLLLVAALLLSSEGWHWLVWVYLGYSLLNGVATWLILTRRV